MLETHAIIPVASLKVAKSRLESTLLRSQISQLVLSMLHDVSTVLLSHDAVETATVVSPDPQVLGFASSIGLETILEKSPAGLNAALMLATRTLIERHDSHSVLILPVDVPLLRESSISGVIEAAEESGGKVVVAARSRNGGTNLLLRVPSDVIDPSFGPGSFSRHQEASYSRGLQFREWASPDTFLDLDTTDDLARFREVGMKTHTWEYLLSVLSDPKA